MKLKKLKKIFSKNLLMITILFPLVVIFFYGLSLSLALKYTHKIYTKEELNQYEIELRNQHKNFLKEKAKYIESFIDFLYAENLHQSKNFLEKKVLIFIESIKKYDSGFIFIFNKDGTLIKHPCAKTLISFNNTNNKDTILKKLIKASNEKQFAYYQGTDCQEDEFVQKVAYIYHINNSDLYIVISKNEKEIAQTIAQKKQLWQKRIDDELQENIKILSIVSFISIIFSLLFSKILNILIKDYEQEIQKSHKVMFSQSRLAQAGELLSMISHQWRQPISKIASITSNLRFKIMMSQTISPEQLDVNLKEIEDYTEFLSETIDDFKEFYKPKHEKSKTFIVPLITKAINFLENEIVKKDIHIHKYFDKDIQLSLYPNELIQVIINIIQNAIEFSPKKAHINIITKVKESEYVILITDHAGGIKEEHLNKIFDAHFSTKTNTNNTNLGLGLYVSKVIIEKHFNGKLEVQSQGDSSTFTIRLIK